jgi:transglutaminase-like putative cysteine protease
MAHQAWRCGSAQARQDLASLSRRSFLKAGLAAAGLASTGFASRRQEWRTFDVRTCVDVIDAKGAITLWLPLVLGRITPYQRALAQTWTGNPADVDLRGDPASRAPMMIATWPAGAQDPTVELTMRVATRDRTVPLSRSGSRAEAEERLDQYLQPTAMIPTDGIVRETARNIIRGHRTQLARARAIYDWVVDNTFRDPSVKGCGLGDVRALLESGSLGGKCADLNALFVGLCRSARLPARDLYGIRVAASQQFKSLGRSGDVTTAQHCRAEVYVDDIGWVPVDPADVRKVILEEEPGASIDAPIVRRARELLFGTWEMNWFAFNDAHDIALPGSKGKRLPFLMYPQVEVDGERRDSLDPPRFHYRITATPLS